jgi:hypothetical protein
MGLSTSEEPSYARSRSSAKSHAPTLNRLPLTPSVNTPRQPGRYGFAQPLHVIWAEGFGTNHAEPTTANTQIARLNIRRTPVAAPIVRAQAGRTRCDHLIDPATLASKPVVHRAPASNTVLTEMYAPRALQRLAPTRRYSTPPPTSPPARCSMAASQSQRQHRRCSRK